MDMVCEEAMSTLGAAAWMIRGGMTTAEVGGAVAASSAAAAEGKPVVLIVQIVAGGCGLNLQFCRRILFLSQHWNPAVVHQAIGRAVRIGQKAVVDIHFFRVVDDVMDNIDLLMTSKHGIKIGMAREVCETLYKGFPVIKDEATAAAPAAV
jgi:hypothetical protein